MKLRMNKFVKKVKKELPWISHLIEDVNTALEVNPSGFEVITKKGSLCLICKGRLFCGRKKCPVLERVEAYFKTAKILSGTELEGSSPPSVFVGRIGYPYVYAGPMVPPVLGDTSLYDLPESWFGSPLEKIVEYRTSLVRGMFKVNVKKVYDDNKLLENTRELALSSSSVDSEVLLKKKPTHKILLDSDVQPLGPSAPLKYFEIGSVKVSRYVEKVYSDTDLKAYRGMIVLYERGIPISSIQKMLSVGALGIPHERKLVPTRWSITATDSMISKHLINKLKEFPEINEVMVFKTEYLDNVFIVMMIPGSWSYELIEAWYPGTVWNADGKTIGICSDWEGYKGRSSYASIGGCYYAARLSVAEYLNKIRRQASVIIFRESYPGHIMPLGVWFVRECVRNALRGKPFKSESLKEALNYVDRNTRIPLKTWLETSEVLRRLYTQRKLTDFYGMV